MRRPNNPFFELQSRQASSLLRLAKLGKKDVFYDLGSGRGLVVRLAASDFPVKKAVGIESEKSAHDKARAIALRMYPKSKLRKIDLWYRFYDDEDIDYSDATVVYNSLEEYEDEIDFYKQTFRRHLRVVKKDLPFVSYMPYAVTREVPSCWFFLMKFPLTKTRSPEKWAAAVLGKPDVGIGDVYRYYERRLRHRNIEDPEDSIKHLKRLASKRF